MIFVRKIHKTKLYLSAELVKKINSDYIEVLVNEKDREIAFVSCDKDTENAVHICKHNHNDGWVEYIINRKQIVLMFPLHKRIIGKWHRDYKCVIFKFKKGELELL